MPWPTGIPPWEETDLTNLSQAGKLSGINPLILAGIAQEESGYEVKGAGFNPEGYGGYYGLGLGQYPAGSATKDELLTNSDASFQSQSILAASAFASYMQQAAKEGYSGIQQVDRAETIFQQGGNTKGIESGGGVSVVNAALGQSSPGNANPATGGAGSGGVSGTGAAGAGTASSNAIQLEGIAGVLQTINDILNPATPGFIAEATSLGTAGVGAIIATIATRAVFSAMFLGLTYIGIKQMTSGGGGSSGPGIMDQYDQIQKRDLAQQRIDANNAATAQRSQPRVTRHEYGEKKSTITHVNPSAEAETARKAEAAKASKAKAGAGTKAKSAAKTVAKDAIEVAAVVPK
jgi:hypothetical protein